MFASQKEQIVRKIKRKGVTTMAIVKPYVDRKNLKPIDFFLSVHNADLVETGSNLKYLYPLEREIDEKKSHKQR